MKALTIFVACAAGLGVAPQVRAADSALGQQWLSLLVADVAHGGGGGGDGSLGGNSASVHAGGGQLDGVQADTVGDQGSGNATTGSSADSGAAADTPALPGSPHAQNSAPAPKPSTLGWQSFLPGSIQ